MSYELAISLALGEEGLNLAAQFVDLSANNIGSPILSGFSEVGSGNYLWYYDSFDDNFRGGIVFYDVSDPGEKLSFLSINPQETNPQLFSGSEIQVNTGHSSTSVNSLSELVENSKIDIIKGVVSESPSVNISDSERNDRDNVINIIVGEGSSQGSVKISTGFR